MTSLSLSSFMKYCDVIEKNVPLKTSLSQMKNTSGAYKKRIQSAEKALKILSGDNIGFLLLCILKKKGNAHIKEVVEVEILKEKEEVYSGMIHDIGMIYKNNKTAKKSKTILNKGDILSIVAKKVTKKELESWDLNVAIMNLLEQKKNLD